MYDGAESTTRIVDAIGAQFRPSASRYSGSQMVTFGRGDMNVPGLSAHVPQGVNGRAILALAIVAGGLLLLSR